MSARKIIVWTMNPIFDHFSRANCKNSKGMASCWAHRTGANLFKSPKLVILIADTPWLVLSYAGSETKTNLRKIGLFKLQGANRTNPWPDDPRDLLASPKLRPGVSQGWNPKYQHFTTKMMEGGKSKVVGWWSSLKVWWRKSHSTGRCFKKKCWINIHNSGRCICEHLPVEHMKIPFINVFLAFLQFIFSSWYVRLTHQMLGSFWTYPADSADAWCTYRPKLSPAHKETNLPRRPKLTLNLQDETHKIVPNLSFNQSGWNWQDTGVTLQIPEILDRNHFWQFQIWDCLKVWRYPKSWRFTIFFHIQKKMVSFLLTTNIDG